MKSRRFFVSLVLAVMLAVNLVPMAHASGTETWSSSVGPYEYLRVTDDNITPIKTIGRAGYLSIYYLIDPCKVGYCNCSDAEPASYPKVKVTCEIRSYPSGEVLAVGCWGQSAFWHSITTYRSLSVGEQVQIYFDVSTWSGTPPGPYRKAHICYQYKID